MNTEIFTTGLDRVAKPKKNKNSTATLPVTDLDLANVAKTAALQWSQTKLPLLWAKPAEFITLADSFELQLTQRNSESSTRPQLTKRLQELDKKIDDGISYVKNYISEEVGKENVQAYYSQFGIEKISNYYKLPVDRGRRLAALEVLVAAIIARGYTNRTYGAAYWQPIATEYREKVGQATQKDSLISGKVSDKNRSKEQIKKTLNALILLIKANYPDSYSSELRKWGFQKEKY